MSSTEYSSLPPYIAGDGGIFARAESRTQSRFATRRIWRELLAHPSSYSIPYGFSNFGAILIAIQESFVRTVVEIFSDIDLSDENKDDRERNASTTQAQTEPFWMDFARFLMMVIGFWVIVFSIFLLIGLAVLYGSGGDIYTVSRYLDKDSVLGKLDKLELQIGELNTKLEDRINSVWKELDEKMKKEEDEMYWKWTTLNLRSDIFEKSINEFGNKDLLSKDESDEFFEEFKKARKNGGSLSVDEIQDYAKQIVQKEIESFEEFKKSLSVDEIQDYAKQIVHKEIESFEEFKKARKNSGRLSVDEIHDYAKQIVHKEIESFEEFKKARKNGGRLSVDEIHDYAKQMVHKEIERMWLMIGSMLPSSAQFLDGCKDKIQLIWKCFSYFRTLL